MNDELAIKVQAFLDGELPEAEAREISSLIASDADVAALHKELKQTRAALAGFEKRIAVPETREFYWSKIAREIERSEAAQERPAVASVSLFQLFRRALIPMAGVAVLAVVMLVSIKPGQQAAAVRTTETEVAAADSNTFTYHNYESGATLVWLSYPAENGLAQGEGAATVN